MFYLILRVLAEELENGRIDRTAYEQAVGKLARLKIKGKLTY